MATKETLRDITTRSNPVVSAGEYGRPLAVVTSLFFMWGFLTCLNDILVPHLKSIFDLSYAQVMLVQFAFFSAYFLFSVPWSCCTTRNRCFPVVALNAATILNEYTRFELAAA